MKLSALELAERMHDTFQLALLDAHSTEVGTDWVDLFEDDKEAYAQGAAAVANMVLHTLMQETKTLIPEDASLTPESAFYRRIYFSIGQWLESFLLPEAN